ncbi:MAG: hypothetical protein ACK6AD_12465 [Cyanobacteriota bacterium]
MRRTVLEGLGLALAGLRGAGRPSRPDSGEEGWGEEGERAVAETQAAELRRRRRLEERLRAEPWICWWWM